MEFPPMLKSTVCSASVCAPRRGGPGVRAGSTSVRFLRRRKPCTEITVYAQASCQKA